VAASLLKSLVERDALGRLTLSGEGRASVVARGAFAAAGV
jgi:hypothetical protein